MLLIFQDMFRTSASETCLGKIHHQLVNNINILINGTTYQLNRNLKIEKGIRVKKKKNEVVDNES